MTLTVLDRRALLQALTLVPAVGLPCGQTRRRRG